MSLEGSGSMKKKALYFEVLNYDRANVRMLHENFQVVTRRDPSSVESSVLHDVDVVFAPLGYWFGKEFIDSAPQLAAIVTNTTSVPHVDVGYAASKNVKVISLEGERVFLNSITATAEFTFGLIIALTRKIPQAFRSVMEGKWSRWEFGGPAMLSSMSLGVVGLGRLGTMVAKYGLCFGMMTGYYDAYVSDAPVQGLRRLDSIEELVRTSDIVTVHIPMTNSNIRFFDRHVFSCFKKGSYFVNTSRGEVVDSLALLEFLRNGMIAGAALDVLDGEFELSFSDRVLSHPLVQYAKDHDNLLITPHIGGSTKDAWFRTQRRVIEIVLREVG
jgi:D-3-phosphoglycerate dehydrogenase